MFTFSNNPQVAEQQMQAVIFYLITFGYIDGDFDSSERDFIRDYVHKLVVHRVKTSMPKADVATQEELIEKFTEHFEEEFERIDQRIQSLFTEATPRDENQHTFVESKLKLRCFEIFQGFDKDGQDALIETVDELLMADGIAHPAEIKFRAELCALLQSDDMEIELLEDGDRPTIVVSETRELVPNQYTHGFFDKLERHYSGDRDTLLKQLGADREIIEKYLKQLEEKRSQGRGLLTGVQKVGELQGREQFLDGYIYVVPSQPEKTYELIVLGDLHGCYSCLKSAVMQSDFFNKVNAYKKDPVNNPDPKLILLGDYIDRGLFSLNGVIRTVVQLATVAPDHVFMLRGNHEYYIEYKGQVFGGVNPAEAINSLKPYVADDNFKIYIELFENMPNMLFVGETLFVHGGIPKDLLIKERYKDLSSLNDPDFRFQMMWSDPSSADVIPVGLQEQSSRFPFGRLQATAFLQRLGCHTLVRGHEKVDSGFERTYDDGDITLITLFSAGGENNGDLPVQSSYRQVTPKGMTMIVHDGDVQITPWKIDYESYNKPEHNSFFK